MARRGTLAGFLAGCANGPVQAPPVADNIRKSLQASGLKDVSVTEDRDKGVVTLGGHVAADGDKSRAELLAGSMAANEVVADEIAILSPNGFRSVKSGVITLKGSVDTDNQRAQVERIAQSVPNIQQVVNEIPANASEGNFDAVMAAGKTQTTSVVRRVGLCLRNRGLRPKSYRRQLAMQSSLSVATARLRAYLHERARVVKRPDSYRDSAFGEEWRDHSD